MNTSTDFKAILGQSFSFGEIRTWPLWLYPVFVLVIFIGLEIVSIIVPMLFRSSKSIPVRGKHLDKLESVDKLYILINKFATALFVFHFFKYTTAASNIFWAQEDLTVWSTLGSFIAFYVFYDFFYMWFHRILHLRSIYGYIHKHHHRQKAPSRGNIDAINVHPFEFVTGEYLHLVTVLVVPCHIYTAIFFIVLGGILASLNHTRYDVSIPHIYDVKVHDVHHRIPESNYGQYTMFWDRLFGSFRPYDHNKEH